MMRRPVRARSAWTRKTQWLTVPTSWRDRLAVLLALLTVSCVGWAFFLANDTRFLMPGPLASVHATIENCSACHTKSGGGNLAWVHGLVARSPLADSQACLTCHKMPDSAFNAHGASARALQQSTKRLTKIAPEIPVPQSARMQSIAFPTDGMVANGLYCATCHQEHQGGDFKLSKMSNEQCRSCHVVKFDSFDGHHPEFERYPFKRRTRIIYDHAGHFGRHFPEVAKKDPTRSIPASCSNCHNSNRDRRIMAVAPFEQTCATCHLNQIVGKERVNGPKGIAFLALPGLDLQTLRRKKVSVGEWPEASEAELTPFMKVMISRNERGRALIKTVEKLNLQDLSKATDGQIRAVANLAWEIKRLFHALIWGKASDVLGDLNIAAGAVLSDNLVVDLTASLPRDVIIGAHLQWLPNLPAEMANRQVAGSAVPQALPGADANRANLTRSLQTDKAEAAKAAGGEERPSAERTRPAPTTSNPDLPAASEREPGSDTRSATPGASPAPADSEAVGKARSDPQACIMAVFGQCLLSKGPEAEPVKSKGAAQQTGAANPKPDSAKEKSATEALPRANRVGLKEIAQATQPEAPAGKTNPANARPQSGKEAATGSEPHKRGADQSDDLLHPTEEELRAMQASLKGTGRTAHPEQPAQKADNANAADATSRAQANASAPNPAARAKAVPVISIQSDVDPESWAEYGGWYRQDYTIFYRPTGHKDKFIYSWLVLTGLQAPKGDTSPAAAVFDFLTGKDAQGSCTKCHSVDDRQGKGRLVNFSPPSVQSKQGLFTTFTHEPHFGVVGTRGCLACHTLAKGRPYLQSYEQGNPGTFVSSFGSVKKELCQTCHTAGAARQDCLLCHKYHVNGVITPIMNTKAPVE